jgi:hypothetical protein
MSNSPFSIVVRQYGFYNLNTSFLIADNYRLLLSTASSDDNIDRQLVNLIPKVFFYFHYPSYENDSLFKTRIDSLYRRENSSNGLTHLMSYRVSLGALIKDVKYHTFNIVKGNYYVMPSMSRRSNFYVKTSDTNVTFSLLDTNMTYVGGLTTCSINGASPVSMPIDFIEFNLRDIDLVFTTLFKFS